MLTTKLVQDIERFKSQPENADFESFSKPGDYFLKQELEYKRDLAARFQDIGMRILARNYENYFDDLLDLLSKQKLGSTQIVQNLVNFRDYGALEKVVGESKDRQLSLAEHLRELLEAADDDELLLQKFDQFITWLSEDGLGAARWTKLWPTLFLFLWRPQKFIFIKPDFFDRMLESYELGKLGRGKPLDSNQYSRVMQAMAELKKNLEDYLGDTDYIGVQSFLWHVHRTLEVTDDITLSNVWLIQPPQEFWPIEDRESLSLEFMDKEHQSVSYSELVKNALKARDLLIFVDPKNRDRVLGEARVETFELLETNLNINLSEVVEFKAELTVELDEFLIAPGIPVSSDLRSEKYVQCCREYLDLSRDSFLLIWNPRISKPDNRTSMDGGFRYVVGDQTTWACANRSARIGDPAYLMRVGVNNKGIVAKARVCEDSHLHRGEHWNPSKLGKEYYDVTIEFEDVRASSSEEYLDIAELEDRLPEQKKWIPQRSGIKILPNVGKRLNALWNRACIDPTNVIYHGPPGTGKTYTLKKQYFPRYSGSSASSSRNELILSNINDKTWREVVAATLIALSGEAKTSEIADHEYCRIKAKLNGVNAKRLVSSTLHIYTDSECRSVGFTKKKEPGCFWRNEDSTWCISKNWDREFDTVHELYEQLSESAPDRSIPSKRFEFVTFHQSYSYEEFVEGIRPTLNEKGHPSPDVSFELVKGVFQRMCDRARTDNSGNRYAIFIDEINRGNISKIFGELITLIEEDKREGAVNELSVTLPYSKKDFSVPKNLDIIATMNTADRSLTHIDAALRRRFTFKELLPDPSRLSTIHFKDSVVDLVRLLQAVNDRIESLFDREHTIGHAYFMHNGESIQGDELPEIFETKVIPLLTEYFFDDWTKVREVLGENNSQPNDIQFVTELKKFRKEGRSLFRLNRSALFNPAAYQKIYE